MKPVFDPHTLMLVGFRILRLGFTNMLWAIGVSSADPVEARW